MQYFIFIIIALISVGFSLWEKLLHHYDKSIFSNLNPNFWDPSVSWKSKYKDGDPKKGEKFLFSTTFLSFLTDSYHGIKSLILFLMVISLNIVYGQNILIGVIISLLIYTFVFGITFNYLFDKTVTFRSYVLGLVNKAKKLFTNFFLLLNNLFLKLKKNKHEKK